MSDSGSGVEPSPIQNISATYTRLSRQYQQVLDRWTPHTLYRWLATGGLLTIFMLRIVFAQGPRFDPSLQEDLLADEIEGGGDSSPLPSQRDDEFRPFVRRLPEWQFWLSATRATIIALLCTLSEIFDVPVYWPILVIYFFTLFALTMRRQIQHMIKYRYVPFDIGRKAKYGGKK
ncbi:hypothetical protein VNI00_007373 [Paramarasmius palmivorus]|uniref:Protein RER1 n=1 Tax=Paramarasmius palmivorus TaxID=297713 RepID=A0AAW0D4T2_9AGAR